LSEEAILVLKDNREDIKKEQLSQKVADDEIAMKIEASKPKQPPKTKPAVDQAQFHNGKDGRKDGPRGQRQWGDRSSNMADPWTSFNNWQKLSTWSSPITDTN
jgi:hypothetical protein